MQLSVATDTGVEIEKCHRTQSQIDRVHLLPSFMYPYPYTAALRMTELLAHCQHNYWLCSIQAALSIKNQALHTRLNHELERVRSFNLSSLSVA